MKYNWVSRIFKRRAFAEDTVEAALAAQLLFEETHPVPYAPSQRRTAIIQRAQLAAKGAALPGLEELVDRALKAMERHV